MFQVTLSFLFLLNNFVVESEKMEVVMKNTLSHLEKGIASGFPYIFMDEES